MAVDAEEAPEIAKIMMSNKKLLHVMEGGESEGESETDPLQNRKKDLIREERECLRFDGVIRSESIS